MVAAAVQGIRDKILKMFGSVIASTVVAMVMIRVAASSSVHALRLIVRTPRSLG